MKVIPKLQDGGYMSLYTGYTPVEMGKASGRSFSPSSLKTQAVSDDDEKGMLTEKDYYQLLSKIDGLPNDTKALVNSLDYIFNTSGMSNSTTRSELAFNYRNALVQISRANFQKKEWDKADAVVTKNGGKNEPAITGNGEVIVSKDGEIKQVTISDYLKNKDKYGQPLTNSNLLWLRANSPEYANNSIIFDIVQNGIGLEQVNKMIRERLSSLGTSETVRSGYSVKADSHIVQGLNVLSEIESAQIAGQAGMTLDGMYKNKIITKDQKQQAESALQYIYNTLPDNAKALLALKSDNMINAKQGAIDIIQQMITSTMNSSSSSDTHWEGTLDQVINKGKKNSSSGSGGDGEGFSDDIKSSAYLNMVQQIAGTDRSFTINNGSKSQMSVNGVMYGAVPDSDGNPLGVTSLQQALVKGLQGITIDTRGITFGDTPIPEEMWGDIIFSGQSGMMAILPITQTPEGAQMVDMDSLDRWDNFTNQLNQRGISLNDQQSVADNQEEIRRLLYENNLEGFVDVVGGGLDYTRLGQFLIVDGQAVMHDGKDVLGNSKYVVNFDPDGSDVKRIEGILSTNDKKDNYKVDPDNWYDWNGHDEFYKGNIYIPITNNQLAALTASKQHVKEPAAMQKEYEYQMLNKQLSAKKPGLLQ